MSKGHLRFKLREETQEAHKRLDDALVAHDLTTLQGLRAYLSVHYLARIHLETILSGYEFLRDDREKVASLIDDFRILGINAPSWRHVPKGGENHPLGLIYVLAGSALGSQLLYKSWRASTDINVAKVKNFMTCSKDNQMWKAFLTHIDTMDPCPDEIQRMVSAANHCFGIFEAANNHQLESLQHV